MQLSENFSLAEMVKSQTAERKGIVNDPSPEQVANLEDRTEALAKQNRTLDRKLDEAHDKYATLHRHWAALSEQMGEMIHDI